MNRPRLLLLIPILLLAVVAGCGEPADLPTVPMKIGSKTYNLEVADTDKLREKGLMERDTLASDHGMIFVFDTPAPQDFWMHHTRFDLDIVFVGENGKVLTTATMKAYDEHTTPCKDAAKYAIEITAGEVKADGIKVGDTVAIPEKILATTAASTRP